MFYLINPIQFAKLQVKQLNCNLNYDKIILIRKT